MAKMPVATFVKNVLSYMGRSYEEIDCSKLLNLASNGLIARGSNTQWRKETGKKGRISDGHPTDPYPAGNDRKSTQLEVGMAVFYHKKEDTDKYPDGLGDYSHVGVVTSVKPLRITNASSIYGRVTDYTSIGSFCAWAYLKDIDYGTQEAAESSAEEGKNMYQARVKTNLNVRQAPGTNSPKVGLLKAGTIVNVYETQKLKNGETWCRVNFTDEVAGWSIGTALIPVPGSTVEPEAPSASEAVCLYASKDDIAALQEQIDELKASIAAMQADVDVGE